MGKYHGEFSELETLVAGLGYHGEWADDGGKKVFRCDDDAILNWWPSTGTLQYQGPEDAKLKLQEAVSTALSDHFPSRSVEFPSAGPSSSTETDPSSASVESKRVFVVHGHDETAKEQLELILHRLGLAPFVLTNTGGGGLTIIEALEREISSMNEKGKRFGIVLLTPDDMGYKQEEAENVEPRARQNVVMEMGMLIAAFGRSRVAILKKGHVEVPSDASGIIYIPFNNHVRETAPRLCERLCEAGFALSPGAITSASA